MTTRTALDTVKDIKAEADALLARPVPKRDNEGHAQLPAHVWAGQLRDEVYALRLQIAFITGLCQGRIILDTPEEPEDIPIPSEDEIEYRRKQGTHGSLCCCDLCSY